MVSDKKIRLAKDSKEVANKLLDIGCVQFNVNNPYTWVSGIRSPIYCDNRKITSYIKSRGVVLNSFVALIGEEFPNCDIVAGVATGGIPMGVMTADRLDKPFIYVRQEPKKHGLMKQVEGIYRPGDRIVLIEDHVSTGGSSLKAIKGLKEAGLKVEAILSIVTYGFEVSISNFSDNNILHYSLCDLDVILDVASETNRISLEEKESILNFKKDPSNWWKAMH